MTKNKQQQNSVDKVWSTLKFNSAPVAEFPSPQPLVASMAVQMSRNCLGTDPSPPLHPPTDQRPATDPLLPLAPTDPRHPPTDLRPVTDPPPPLEPTDPPHSQTDLRPPMDPSPGEKKKMQFNQP